MNPQDILNLLDTDAVLIPIRHRSKAPDRMNGWQKLSFANISTPAFQNRLARAKGLAVSLGGPSQGLCTIDFDDDNALAEFIALNPELEATLTTTAHRGANLWLKIKGPYPPPFAIKCDDQPLGEWRATGNYTIITGTHQKGMPYRFLNETPPLPITYESIKWPEGWQTSDSEVKQSLLPPPLSEISKVSANSKPSEVSTLSMPINEKSFAQRVLAAEQARENLNKTQTLAAFYDKHIGRIYSPQQGQRNNHLIKITTHLYFTVSKERALELLIIFHHLNQDIFLDPLAQHEAEAEAHLMTLEQDFLSKLTSHEAAIYQQLPTPYDDAFRILYDLARHESTECPPPEFFISHADLGFRLDIPKTTAGRILASLISLDALEIMETGSKRMAGQRGKATRYRWRSTF